MTALLTVLLGGLAHASGGECVSAPAISGLLLSFGVATWILVRHEVGGVVLLCWLALGQVMTHAVMQLSCTDAGESHAPGGHRLALLLGHVLAVVATAALLRRAESAMWVAARLRRLARALGLRLLPAVVPKRPGPLPRPCPAGLGVRGARELVVTRAGRRGPPVRLAS